MPSQPQTKTIRETEMTPTREMANNAKMVTPLQDDDHPITKRDLREMEARLEETLKATMAPMQVLINNLTSKVEALENKNQMHERIIEQYREENARVNKKLDELVNQMEAEHNEMKIKQADLEDRNRRCNIRFRNFPEKTEEKSPADLIIRWLKNTIPSLKLEAEDLERAHRALKPMPKPSAPPRDIIVCFTCYQKKEEIWHQLRNSSNLRYGETPILALQDLSQDTLNRRKSLRPCTQRLQQAGIKYRWGFPFRLIVTTNTTQHMATNIPEALQLLKNLELDLPPEWKPTNPPSDSPNHEETTANNWTTVQKKKIQQKRRNNANQYRQASCSEPSRRPYDTRNQTKINQTNSSQMDNPTTTTTAAE
uniref:L1 transposable element RRM domain-containing protein n=1 Tax=Podarcis muralis TaxID=64176 RepID=A0A670HS05_PODMU